MGKGEQGDFIKHTHGVPLTADGETTLQVGRAHEKVNRRHKNVFKRVMLNLYVARKIYHFLRYLNRTVCVSCIWIRDYHTMGREAEGKKENYLLEFSYHRMFQSQTFKFNLGLCWGYN